MKHTNFGIIIEYRLRPFGTNAHVEKFFSSIDKLSAHEKSQSKVVAHQVDVTYKSKLSDFLTQIR